MMKKENWFLWIDSYHAPAINMAIDELLLLSDLEYPILRLYKWSSPAISMGYTQKIEFAPQEEKQIIRRLTGGGFVDHTTQYTYSVIFPKSHWINKETPLESYRLINLIIIRALKNMNLEATLAQQLIPQHIDRNKMVCFETPTRYDILVGNEKVAGAAQRRTKDGILHQGSISIKNMRIKKIERSIPLAFEKVFNIRFNEWECTKIFLSKTQVIAQQKYSNPDWTNKR